MAMKVRALLSTAAVLIAMSLTGCGHYTCGTTFGNANCTSSGGGITQGGGGTGGGLVAFTYFTDFSTNGQGSAGTALQVLDQSAGTYTPISAFVPPTVPLFPTGIVIVGKQFAYIPSADSTLYSFTIDPTTGFYTDIGLNPLSVIGGDSIAASASGKFLFIGDTGTQQISAYSVNADGSLTVVSGSPFATGGVSPRVMATDGQSKFLYVTAGIGSTAIAALSIGSSGALTSVGTPLISNVSSIAADPSGKFLLGVSWQNGDNTIHLYSINSSTGALTAAGSTVTSGTPRNIAIHPNGQWVYTFSEDPVLVEQEAVEGFDFDSNTGVLTNMSGSPFTSIIANGGAIEQSGQFLFGLGLTLQPGGLLNTITPYSIDSSTGELAVWPPGVDASAAFPSIDEAAFAATDAP
jgi:6-phosphogluconolactonase (cycloisomerase 2 family)